MDSMVLIIIIVVVAGLVLVNNELPEHQPPQFIYVQTGRERNGFGCGLGLATLIGFLLLLALVRLG